MSPPPTPFHILRGHSAPLSAFAFSPENRLLYAGDQDGYVSITDLRSRRPVSHWKAHEGGVLSVEEYDGRLICHGRDNALHIHHPTPQHGTLSSGPGPSRSAPSIDQSLTTNSLNFCRFSLCPLSTTSEEGKEALLAVPNLVDSELVDIYLLPSRKRLHASINYVPKPKLADREEMSVKPEEGRTGLVMGIHLAFDRLGTLNCVMGFEDGRIEVWHCGTKDDTNAGEPSSSQPKPEVWRTTWDARMSSGPKLWEKVYEAKGHNEAVMAMTVDRQLNRAFTVSADHLVVRYDLSSLTDPSAPLQLVRQDAKPEGVKSFSTGSIGNASIAVSHDGAIVAVGGWDGKIRLFSASSLKPLGTLAYHRDTVNTLAFANPHRGDPAKDLEGASTIELGVDDDDEDEDSDDEGAGGMEDRRRWLASGGKDNRIALWALKDFTK